MYDPVCMYTCIFMTQAISMHLHRLLAYSVQMLTPVCMNGSCSSNKHVSLWSSRQESFQNCHGPNRDKATNMESDQAKCIE
jgi:hypothetical protein